MENRDELIDYAKNVLNKINWKIRYYELSHQYRSEYNQEFEPKKKEIKEILKKTIPLKFKNHGNGYVFNLEKKELIYRLYLDIKGQSILPYIYVLQKDQFIPTGITHFGHMFRKNDLELYQKLPIKKGFSKQNDFEKYLLEIFKIFEDFSVEYENGKSEILHLL